MRITSAGLAHTTTKMATFVTVEVGVTTREVDTVNRTHQTPKLPTKGTGSMTAPTATAPVLIRLMERLIMRACGRTIRGPGWGVLMTLMAKLNSRVIGRMIRFLRKAKLTMTMAKSGRTGSGKMLNSMARGSSWIHKAGSSMMGSGDTRLRTRMGLFITGMERLWCIRGIIGLRSSGGRASCLMLMAISPMPGVLWKMLEVARVPASIQKMAILNIPALG